MSLNGYKMIIRGPRDLGLLVRDIRRKGGFTQAELASHVGVSRKWVIDLENGKRTADLSLVLQTLNAIGIDLDAKVRKARSPDADINAIVETSKRRR